MNQIMWLTIVVSVAAAAAKINAQLQAKKGIQHVDVPPIRSVNIHPLRLVLPNF
jgi:hypothetical protein